MLHSPQEALSLIRAKEEAQAAFALAVFRKEAEAARSVPLAPTSSVVVGTTTATDRESESTLVDIPVMAASQPNLGRSKAVLASCRGRRKGNHAIFCVLCGLYVSELNRRGRRETQRRNVDPLSSPRSSASSAVQV